MGDFPATFDYASVMSMTSGDQWDMTQVSEEKRPYIHIVSIYVPYMFHRYRLIMVINGG